MAILDQYGNPIDSAVLAEPQTSKLTWLKREFARHPSRGLTPAKLASILQGAELGNLHAQAELFADMEEKDGHILSEMAKRKRALLTIPWDVVPPQNPSAAETALTAEVKEWLQARTDLDDLILDLMDAAGHAYSCVEIEWQRVGRDWQPAKLTHRLPSWFQLDRETWSEIRLRDMSWDGAVLRPFGWIVHIHKAKSGHIARAGLHRALAWPFLFKNYAVRDLAEFLEVYGLPVRLGKYPSGSGDTEKSTLLKAVTDIGHNAAGIIPDGMSIELLEAAKGTDVPFVAMFKWCEDTESKVIVGQVLSGNARSTGMGSGVAQLQAEVREDIKVSDARQVSGTLTRDLIYPWLAINRGMNDPSRAPRFQFDTQMPSDLKLYADSLPQLVGMGLKIPASYVHDLLKIPVAKEGEQVLETTKVAPPPFAARLPGAGGGASTDGGMGPDRGMGGGPDGGADAGADPGAEPLRRIIAGRTGAIDAGIAAATDDQNTLGAGADALAAEWQKTMGPRVDELTAMLAQTHDLATFRDRLAALLKADPPPALVESLTRAGFVSGLLGETGDRR